MSFQGFHFAFPCPDISAESVTDCFDQLFSFCGFPTFVHSDRGSSFISKKVKHYLHQKGISTSNSTPYHPTGNGQIERLNESLWKNICLALKTHNLDTKHWEVVLPAALHAQRSLLCTATNMTLHERFFSFPVGLLLTPPCLLGSHLAQFF